MKRYDKILDPQGAIRDLENAVIHKNKQLADAQATIAALQARLDERQEFIKDCDIALDRIQAPRTNEGQEELVSTWRRIELVGSLLSQYRSTLEQMSTQLTQRTAELEALRPLYDDMWTQFAESQAELERVRAERDEYINKTKMLCLQNGPLMIENHDMKKLIAALPKVEGEIRVGKTVDDCWFIDNQDAGGLRGTYKDDGPKYAALLQHRQGMEG